MVRHRGVRQSYVQLLRSRTGRSMMDEMETDVAYTAELICVHAHLQRRLNETARDGDDRGFAETMDEVEFYGWMAWCHFCWFIQT